MARPFAFVIMPFDRAVDDLYELGIKAACEAAGADCARADKQIFVESIPERIHADIERADLVIAELTDRNPNVYYETGYAHGLSKPVLLLTTSAEDIPFDLSHYPYLVHEGRITFVKEELERRVRWVVEDPERAKATLRRRTSAQDEELERMARHILNYLAANGFRMVSFERVRENINAAYSDEKLAELIERSPDRFRRVKVQGGRPGIGLTSRSA
jgi:hypothetical protein